MQSVHLVRDFPRNLGTKVGLTHLLRAALSSIPWRRLQRRSSSVGADSYPEVLVSDGRNVDVKQRSFSLGNQMTTVEFSKTQWLQVFYEALRNYSGTDEQMNGMFDLEKFRRDDPGIDLVIDDVIAALSDYEFEEKNYARKYFKNFK